MSLDPAIAARLKRNDAGLVAAVAQQRGTGEVLMLAWMNDEALGQTLATRKGTYWSRSRNELWVKGATSGHTQHVHEVRLHCDGDTVLLIVEQTGPACHTGARTCFDADLLGGQRTSLPSSELADATPSTAATISTAKSSQRSACVPTSSPRSASTS